MAPSEYERFREIIIDLGGDMSDLDELYDDLYSPCEFQSRFETPITENSDMNALGDLGKHIRPFILRRMKKDVLAELLNQEQNILLVLYLCFVVSCCH